MEFKFYIWIKILLFTHHVIVVQSQEYSTKLLCDYYFYNNQAECFVDQVDLTDLEITTQFIFSGSPRVKSQTVMFGFLSSNLNFVPQSIVKQFPNIETLQLKRCRIPETIDNQFLQGFHQITRITISYSKIKHIEENAFAELRNLERIWLNDNQLEAITSNIFKNNMKLKFIHLGDNKIQRLIPTLFDNLVFLEELHFRNNICASRNFDNIGGILLKLNDELRTCYV